MTTFGTVIGPIIPSQPVIKTVTGRWISGELLHGTAWPINTVREQFPNNLVTTPPPTDNTNQFFLAFL